MLDLLFLKYTDLPKDLINIIVKYTECNCRKGQHKLLRIQRNKCKHCKTFTPTMTSHLSICNTCKNTLRFQDKKCVICHSCLVKDQQVFTCLQCEDLIFRFG